MNRFKAIGSGFIGFGGIIASFSYFVILSIPLTALGLAFAILGCVFRMRKSSNIFMVRQIHLIPKCYPYSEVTFRLYAFLASLVYFLYPAKICTTLRATMMQKIIKSPKPTGSRPKAVTSLLLGRSISTKARYSIINNDI